MTKKRQEVCDGQFYGGGIHCCHFYHGIPHLLSTVVPLVQVALHRNARCTLSLCIAARRGVVLALQKAGFDLIELKRRDQLELLTESQITRLYRAFVQDIDRQLLLWENRLRKPGYTCQFFIGQAELPIKFLGWEPFLFHERKISAALKGRRINIICLYPFAQTCMGPHYEEIRSAHPRLLSAGSLLDYKGSLVGGNA